MSVAGDKIDPKRKESPARGSRSPRGQDSQSSKHRRPVTPKVAEFVDINQDLNLPSSPKVDKTKNGTIKLVNMAPYMVKTEKTDVQIGMPRYSE